MFVHIAHFHSKTLVSYMLVSYRFIIPFMLQWRESQADAESWWYGRWEGPGTGNVYDFPSAWSTEY